MSFQPLAGVTVLDLSRILAGPWATQLLADFGADVIKVEATEGGDATRGWGPPFVPDKTGSEDTPDQSAYFQCANHGKASIAVDLKAPGGRELILRMAETADLIVENFRPGVLSRLGLDYARLKSKNPRLVLLSITGFGQEGPLADKPGFDAMIQAMGGLMSVTGTADGPPTKTGVAITDLMTGMYGAVSMLAALRTAEQTGQGCHLDLSLFDVQIASLANQAQNYLATGEDRERLGNAHPNIVPYQTFATSDGHLMLAIGSDRQFARWCAAIGKPQWASDPRFSSNAGRVENRAELVPALADIIRQKTSDHWLALCDEHAVPCGPVNSVSEAFALANRGGRSMVAESAGSQRVRNPVLVDGARLDDTSAPPHLGSSTDKILGNLGFSPEQIRDLRSSGVVG